MHPMVVQDQPGDCPLCGMALELQIVTVEETESSEFRDLRLRYDAWED